MRKPLPRIVIAAPASGHGKTTIATGLMAALSNAGHTVSGHKVGPDYIDPGYHALATGRPGRNLDPHLVGEHRIVPLLRHGSAGADVAVIEGVMGLYDGQIGGDGYASTAHLAELTETPVVLVVDCSSASRSIAAVIHGMRGWRDGVQVGGVILNKLGSPRHEAEIRAAIGDDVPILGVLHRDDGIEAPSRHLGLVPAAERDDAAARLDRLAAQIQRHVDLDAVMRLARGAPDLTGPTWTPDEQVTQVLRRSGRTPVIAMAGGRAFTFRYAETAELLRATGCDVIEFDPLRDSRLPAQVTGLYLGGGFPEMHAADLSANTQLLAHVADSVRAGLPTVAECAGLLYLCRSIKQPDTTDSVPMAGVLPFDGAMAPRLTLSYREATAAADNLLAPAGMKVRGHEFHRTALGDESTTGARRARRPVPGPAWSWPGVGRRSAPTTEGFADARLHASYLHLNWAGQPELAMRFAIAAAAFDRLPAPGQGAHTSGHPSLGTRARRLSDRLAEEHQAAVTLAEQPRQPTAVPPELLRHHGDVEATDGLLDLAVNVFDGPRPRWLDQALLRGLDASRSYPSPEASKASVSAGLDLPAADRVLLTSGAAEAFTLAARLRPWRSPVVVHPQFTEPDVALASAGHSASHVILDVAHGFRLDPAQVPDSADLVIVGNPTNPTGVRHPATALAALRRPGRLVVIDEAFCDDGVESMIDLATDIDAAETHGDLLVLRSLTKLWGIPGIRAGYAVGTPALLQQLTELQPPWSVSSPALAALAVCHTPAALAEAEHRVARIAAWRAHLVTELDLLGIQHTASVAPFVLARVGEGVHASLREAGIAVRRCDTFPGLGADWIRIAVRDEPATDRLLHALGSLVEAATDTSRD